jgi:hypothetical protein
VRASVGPSASVAGPVNDQTWMPSSMAASLGWASMSPGARYRRGPWVPP